MERIRAHHPQGRIMEREWRGWDGVSLAQAQCGCLAGALMQSSVLAPGESAVLTKESG